MWDFGILPPEVNSARMYTGPGSGPMLAAASAWDALSWQLESFATGYSSVLSELQGRVWSGGSALAMAAAAAPYVAWANTTAALTEQTANQARTIAAAYEAAFVATVPPAAVAANRAQLATLVATNFFGQNTPAIAATEIAYAEMWAQDAVAMYGYAAAATAAGQLNPFQQPPNTTSGQPQTALPATVSPDPVGDAVSSTVNGIGGVNTVTKPLVFEADTIRTAGQMGNWIMALIPAAKAAAKVPAAVAAGEVQAGAAGARAMVLAGVGRAAPVGGLSVPASWPSAPATGAAAQPVQLAAAHSPLSDAVRSVPRVQPHVPPAGLAPLQGRGQRRVGYPVMRMRDRRWRMPRPAVGG